MALMMVNHGQPCRGCERVGALRVSSPYGPRVAPKAGATTMHRGIDLPAPVGTPVLAALSGRVYVKADAGACGRLVQLTTPDGWRFTYCHLQGFAVGNGARVRRGQTLGFVGVSGNTTGPHLHFSVKTPAGVYVDPVSVYPRGSFRHG